MTEYVDPDDVAELIERLGFAYRDRNLLLSSLASPMPVFGEEVYPGLDEKAAVLLSSINHNHPLLDGNKRISWLITAAFYELNGYDLVADNVDAAEAFVRGVADGSIDDLDQIEAWLADHRWPL